MSIEAYTEKAATLIEALPYLQAFRGQTFLIKMGGSAMENPELVKKVMRDVVFLEVVLCYTRYIEYHHIISFDFCKTRKSCVWKLNKV